MKCNKCEFERVCGYKKEYINLLEKTKNLDLGISNEISNMFSVKLKCNYFKNYKLQTQ